MATSRLTTDKLARARSFARYIIERSQEELETVGGSTGSMLEAFISDAKSLLKDLGKRT